jgi:hypothetical protein
VDDDCHGVADEWNPQSCRRIDDGEDRCMEECLLDQWTLSRPTYNLFGRGDAANSILSEHKTLAGASVGDNVRMQTPVWRGWLAAAIVCAGLAAIAVFGCGYYLVYFPLRAGHPEFQRECIMGAALCLTAGTPPAICAVLFAAVFSRRLAPPMKRMLVAPFVLGLLALSILLALDVTPS